MNKPAGLQTPTTPPRKAYIGRFAPSPTGPLHFGSLVAAVGSYLEARTNGGQWLLRIEDVDKPRSVPGMVAQQIAALTAYGFAWDGEVWHQSQRADVYQAALDALIAAGLAYPCTCTRRQLAALPDTHIGIDGALVYPGCCAGWQIGDAVPPGAAWRVRVGAVAPEETGFHDHVQRAQAAPSELACPEQSQRIEKEQAAPPFVHCQNLPHDVGDFVLRRADGCYTYQLAVVVDDLLQGITHIVRGADLIDSTPRQVALILALQPVLGGGVPSYAHLPVAVNAVGEKLSKQTHATALPVANEAQRVRQLWQALDFLGQQPDTALQTATQKTLWAWALAHWSLARVPQQRAMQYALV